MKTATTENYKAKVSFVDKKRQRVNVKLEITDGRFSIQGDCGSSSGQCQDSIDPATDAQRKLLGFWNDWHLNDMHAGTPEQDAAIEEGRAIAGYPPITKTFDWAVDLLKSQGLYEVPDPRHPGESYAYGRAWLKRDLPEDFQAQVEAVVAALRAEAGGESTDDPKLSELGEPEALGTIVDMCSVADDDAELILALAKMFDLRVSELSDIDVSEKYPCHVTIQGVDYLAGTDEEMDKVVAEQIKEDLWAFNASFLAGYTKFPEKVFTALQKDGDAENSNDAFLALVESRGDLKGFVEEAIVADGRAHFLNRYDGSEHEATVNGTTFYAYRQ